MERRRHPRQQRRRDRRRQRQRQMPGRAGDVARRDRARRRPATAAGALSIPRPERKLGRAPRILRVRHEPLRPAPERRPARRQRRRPARRNRRPRRRKIRHQDAPRDPVDRQDDGWSAAAARRAAAPGIEPHRLHHHARPPAQACARPPAPVGNAGAQRFFVEPADVDPPQAVAAPAPRRAARSPGSSRRLAPSPISRSRNAS